MKHALSKSSTLQLLQIFLDRKLSYMIRLIFITVITTFLPVLTPSTSAEIITIRFGGDIPCVGITIGQNGKDSQCNYEEDDQVIFGIEDDWYFVGELTYTDWRVTTPHDYTEYFLDSIVAALGPNPVVAQQRFDNIWYDGEYDQYYGPLGTLVVGNLGHNPDNKYDSVQIADNSFDLTSAPAPVDAFIANASHDGEFLVEYHDGYSIAESPIANITLLKYGLDGDPDFFDNENVKVADDLSAYLKYFDINYFGFIYTDQNGSVFDIRAPIDWVAVSEPSTLGLLLIGMVGLLRAKKGASNS